MKANVLFAIFSVVLMAISYANAASTAATATTEAPQSTTESPSFPQWSWTDFIRFCNGSSSGNKFYFFF
ncbi:uncharacterized protein LOC119555205 [Drosophila subpulchrella]|uniref:uncharacterized protein LOC119555205 n=1 Tax=Drosophila subpulchrella TaxID=1486046 RepID=UPI0018A17DD9|nr:uncharacterized protein LOC119555205 [Drosophila subpulchrella]